MAICPFLWTGAKSKKTKPWVESPPGIVHRDGQSGGTGYSIPFESEEVLGAPGGFRLSYRTIPIGEERGGFEWWCGTGIAIPMYCLPISHLD